MLKNRDLAQKTFTDSVRSVLFIDDQFPTYEELTTEPPSSRAEAFRARSLVKSCRDRHYVCDVQNDPDVLEKIGLDRIGVSDLIVVDYHLRGIDRHNDDVLNFLAKLARSPHFNLVVLYTGEKNLAKVRLHLAARLRGDAPPLRTEEADSSNPLPEISIEPRALANHVDLYLRDPRGLADHVATLFPNDVEAVRAIGSRKHALFQRNFEPYLKNDLQTEKYTGPSDYLEISMATNGATDQWVQAGNVFVAIVAKTPDNPEADDIGVLLNKLNDCIVAWSPSLIDIMLTAAASSILRCGLRQLTPDFADANLRTGLVYWFLAGESSYGDFDHQELDADRRNRIEVLYRAVFEVLCNAALKKSTEISDEVVKQAIGSEPKDDFIGLAKKWARTNDVREEGMLLAANSFLCSSSFDGGHITSGTVFRRENTDEYWICMSAACDMAPRGKSNNKWREHLFPLRMMLAARLEKVPSPAAALPTATRGRHIFARIDGADMVFEFMTANEPEPQLAPMFAANAATVSKGKFNASFLRKDDKDLLSIEAMVFEPVAQLRENYASRLLQQTGTHLSRIGVDFLDRPKSKSKKTSSPLVPSSSIPTTVPAKDNSALAASSSVNPDRQSKQS